MGTFTRFIEVWWWWIDLGATGLAVLTIPSVLVNRRGRPASALSWILCLLGVPLLGLFLWWTFGRRYLERRRRRKRRAHATMSERFASLRTGLEPPPSESPGLLPLRYLPEELQDSVFPSTKENRVELFATGARAYDAMEQMIRGARHHIHALFYIWNNDKSGRRFRDLLIAKAKEGVQVRVLCDAIGSPAIATKFSRRLRKAGARVARFLPPQLLSLPRINFRNHRKILVVDGAEGVIGGFNIGDEYRDRWRDMGVRVSGPAVDQLQEIFADDWYYATNEDLAAPEYFGCWKPVDSGAPVAVIASGPDTHESPIHDALFIAINGTKKRLLITTPYFIPTQSLLSSIRAAEYRGVDVQIMLPGLSDVPLVRYAARSYYPELLAVGARIYEYQPSMLHSKVLVFDDELAVIGSANLDSRSFRLNFESSCFVGGHELSGELAAVFEADLKNCVEVRLDDLAKQPWLTKLLDSTAHLLSPLL